MNSKHKHYASYGGRGIKMLFETFIGFLKHIGPRPTHNHSLDRIDNDGHYEPGDVRWATRIEQGANKRSNARIVVNGVKVALSTAIRDAKPECTSKEYAMMSNRFLNCGWCIACSINQPKGGACVHKTKD